jgi:predicted dehydrogenase
MIEGNNERGGRRVRLGMVGGGQGAFIGAVHRIAARLDDDYQLLAGALSSDAQRALDSGRQLGLADDRCYADYRLMATAEAAREDGIEAVAIVTPNHVHFPVAKAFLEAGIHVICDKPITVTSAEADDLVALARAKDCILAVTYNYSGYPMIRQARAMIAAGELGKLRLVQAEYVQDWLTENLESSGQKQAAWRTDPARSGAGGCVGDIGTHAYHLACFVTGQKPSELCAELTSFVDGRVLDDNAQVLLRYASGMKGMLWASQVAPGNENALSLRIYGDQAGLSWRQEEPNTLWFTPYGQSPLRVTRGGPAAGAAAARMTRIPSGHPEGYLEGFANIYREIASAVRAARSGAAADAQVLFPTGEDGASGMRFIEATVASSAAGATWVRL